MIEGLDEKVGNMMEKNEFDFITAYRVSLSQCLYNKGIIATHEKDT